MNVFYTFKYVSKKNVANLKIMMDIAVPYPHYAFSKIKYLSFFSGKIHAPKHNFLAVHDIIIGMTDHFAHEAEAMTAKKQKDLMESS